MIAILQMVYSVLGKVEEPLDGSFPRQWSLRGQDEAFPDCGPLLD